MYEIRTLIFMRTRVLLLDGHTIQVLPFLKAYAALNVEVTIFCENKLSYGYFSRYNKHTVICPPIAENVIAYKTFLLDYIRKYPQDMLFPYLMIQPNLRVSLNKKSNNMDVKWKFRTGKYSLKGMTKNL